MKQWIAALALVAIAAPAYAQFGGLLDKAKKAQEGKKKLDALNVSEDEERRIGDDVSAKIRQRFGVVQDAAVHKYVTEVGLVLARSSERPKLAWTFIVLDTDGVNAFAAPGGIVHITRGALGLIKNEGELAGVLAHEIGHVAHKHAVNAIRKANGEKMLADATVGDRGPYLDKLANMAYGIVLENKFDRGDELDADAESVQLTRKVGYAPASLADFLTRLDDRNKDQPERNGLFASHPETKERIDKVRALAGTGTGAVVQPRYAANISYKPTPITAIAAVEGGASGLTGSTSTAKDSDKDKQDKDAKKDDPPKKKGFGLGALKQTVAPEQQSAQVQASGGSRGLGPDRAAKGGSNPAPVRVAVSDADLAAFRKGIA
jgi:Zn-dependent protease with chaperone function